MWLAHLHTAWRSLLSRLGRSSLTVSSIAIGVFGVVLMTSLAQSGLKTLLRGIEELGAARMVLLQSRPPEREKQRAHTREPGFDLREKQRLVAGVPHLLHAALYSSLGARDLLSDQGRAGRSDVVAADADFFEVFHMRLARGRALSDGDSLGALRVCVVGPALGQRLFPGGALDHWLTLGSFRCRVVGVLAKNERFGTNFGFDWDDLVVVPFGSAQGFEPDVRRSALIALESDGPEANSLVMRVLNSRLVAERGALDDFTFIDLSGVVAKFHRTFALMQGLVGVVAGVALLIGGIGIMNMLLVSVAERVREIGVSKALGATPAWIRGQFLVEALLLAGCGAGFGAGSGLALALGAGALIRTALPQWVVSVSLPATLAAVGSALLVGALFGWLPAQRAARLSPVEAMRR